MADDNDSHIETWVKEYGDYLFSFALLKVKDIPLAEDLVQETLIAAITAEKNFSHQSSVRTWLTSILKHKMIDHFRRQGRRELAIGDLVNQNETDDVDLFFKSNGQWVEKPEVFLNPESALKQKEFWKVFQHCLSGLKTKQAEIFLAKEIHGMSNAEICKDFSITPTNAWVLTHRARISLSSCLKKYWGH